MLRKLLNCAFVAALAIMGQSCNSDAEQSTVSLYANTAVDAFSLGENDKVLAHLDSVFFSIDLNNAKIFNADSLPKGTDVSKLPVKITTSDVGKVELIVRRANMSDTTYNYSSSQSDSIDFSRGPVTLRVTARNGDRRDYEVKVNVHRMEPDSLWWDRTALAELPTRLAVPGRQRTIEFKGEAVTYTSDGSAANVAVSANPADGWVVSQITLPVGARLRTITATTDALYLLDGAGALYCTDTPDGAWTRVDDGYTGIIGGYGSTLMALRGGTTIVGYPTGAIPDMGVPDGFPVEGASNMLLYTSKWTPEVTAIIAGGLDASGNPTKGAWAFDGHDWQCINTLSPLPPLQGMAIVPYFAYRLNADWSATEQTVIMAFGGIDVDGKPSKELYISANRGITWRKAGTTMTLPDYMPAFGFADALVFSSELHLESRGGSLWHEYEPEPLPRWWKRAESVGSRAVTQVTAWECPYIYLFGGVNAEGNLLPTVWRGVINRLTFVPLY